MTATVLVPILVVDDNAAKRLALRSVLMPLGYHIVEADSGVSALRCITDQDFAVILLDIRMPVMDGFETAALIRQREQSETTPIIFITAYGADEINADRYAGGAVDFLFAPVPPEELRAKVSVFASLYLRATKLASHAEAVQASADEFKMLVEAVPVGIFRADVHGRLLYTNPRWSELTGISAELALGQRWNTASDTSQQLHLVDGPTDTTMPAADRCQKFEMRRPDSTAQTVLATTRPTLDGAGQSSGLIGTLTLVAAEAPRRSSGASSAAGSGVASGERHHAAPPA
ncbi:MAG TPA: response regulator [Nocardioidaceae bacterium]|nr:response regulator [Nocardioidaceae bacterium]